jgi:Ala-tRNA(Pro) deacylase
MMVLEKIKKFLDDNSIKYDLLTHDPIHTSQEAANVRGADISTGAKSLVFRSKGEFFMVVISGDKKVNMKKLRQVLNIQSLSLAHPDEVLEVMHCKIGSVHPFGNLFGIQVYLEKSVLRNEFMTFSAGRHDTSITMKVSDYEKAVNPVLVEVSQD